MKVRPLEPGDAKAWSNLRQALLPDPGRDDAAELKRLHVPWVVLVADNGRGELIGYAHATVRSVVEGVWFESSAYLEEIWVQPDHRRTGVGKALFSTVMEWARSQGVRHIGSDTQADNRVSREWHRAVGFAEEEVAVHFLRPIDGSARSRA